MESYLLLSTIILSSLIDTSVSLSCIQCLALGEEPCTKPSVQCPPESDVCVSMLQVSSIVAIEMKTFTRFCGDRSMCSGSGSYSTPISKIKVVSSCCYTNNCSPTTLILPTDKTESNGVSCKGCPTKDKKPCPSEDIMECTGDENKCISVSVSGQSPDQSVRGCGTPGLCNKSYNTTEGARNVQTQILCSENGSVDQQQSKFLFLIPASFLFTLLW
ncbi:phospholipase A2 inhibitor and Ly6/PLAUR domain-containing protein-like [Mixophyes fleayi]|uniref:phospholipase A2 inhibitor and Ly6/PLAUR domain-containing protein-like n=1 Tax=Mixophyes fleayi TaxID=3061075 RepID=UPI003F4DACFC